MYILVKRNAPFILRSTPTAGQEWDIADTTKNHISRTDIYSFLLGS